MFRSVDRPLALWLAVTATGCAATGHVAGRSGPTPPEVIATDPNAGVEATAPDSAAEAVPDSLIAAMAPQTVRERTTARPATRREAAVVPVSAESSVDAGHRNEPLVGTLTVEGKTYDIELVDRQRSGVLTSSQVAGEPVRLADGETSTVPPAPAPEALNATTLDPQVWSEPAPVVRAEAADIFELNLPTALSMVGGRHPVVGLARWRVQAAYAELDRANVLWLPSIRPGFSFHRHDGNYQASDGSIIDVNRNSFQYGLGNNATGAGTTPNPGVVATFHVADAIFAPEIAEKAAWASGHAATAATNRQLLDVALAYQRLVGAEQDARILDVSRGRTAELAKLTADFAEAGEGLQADADRLQTELALVGNRSAEARERSGTASIRLAEAASIGGSRRLVPLDFTALPVDLGLDVGDTASLVASGLSRRPELKEAQALVAAACEAHRRQKYAPFVPSVLLGFSAGGFGGGLGSTLADVEDRYDFDAAVTWEVRNLGFGESAARRRTRAEIQQARYEKLRRLDRVAREISEAHTQVIHRSERVAITERAVSAAADSYERNLRRIRDGQGIPLEVLQSLRAYEDAQREYLRAVIDYNEAQFTLGWALGWPVRAS